MVKKKDMTIIGAGGVGSALLDLVAKEPSTGKIYLIDDDIVERKNLSRQNFKEEDIGNSKVLVLADRYKCIGIPERFLEGMPLKTDIVISCVDNNLARQAIRLSSAKVKIFAANELDDAEAYVGCEKTYEIFKGAFDPREENLFETTHCDSDEAPVQTCAANRMAALLALMMLKHGNPHYEMSVIGLRAYGGILETIRNK